MKEKPNTFNVAHTQRNQGMPFKFRQNSTIFCHVMQMLSGQQHLLSIVYSIYIYIYHNCERRERGILITVQRGGAAALTGTHGLEFKKKCRECTRIDKNKYHIKKRRG